MNAELFVKGDVSLNSTLCIGSDTSMNAELFVKGDVSLNSTLCVGSDVSLNTKLFVKGDVSMNSNLNLPNGGISIGKPTIKSGYVLDLSGNINHAGVVFQF
jgi:predicted acyltransferase (DUF342 family)